MSSPPSLIAIVVTHNRRAALEVTLTRLLQSAPAHLAQVLVVDNASTDGTADWLAAQDDPRLQVLTLDDNRGGAGGFEAGMAQAAQQDPDWMVLMDDDARPYPGTLKAFGEADRSAAEVWAAAVYDAQGGICDMNRPSRNPFWHRDAMRGLLRGKGREAYHIPQAAYEATAPRPIDVTSFVGFFISRAGRALAGQPEGRLFIYGDDVLYALKLRQAGGRILFDPGLRFEHAYASQEGAGAGLTPLWKVYYYYRNLLLAYRVASGRWFVLVAPVMALKWLLALRHYRGRRGRYLALWALALRDGLLKRTGLSFARVRGWSGD